MKDEPSHLTHERAENAAPYGKFLGRVWMSSRQLTTHCPGLREIVEIELAAIKKYNEFVIDKGDISQLANPIRIIVLSGFPYPVMATRLDNDEPVMEAMYQISREYQEAWRANGFFTCTSCGLPARICGSDTVVEYLCPICDHRMPDLHPLSIENSSGTPPTVTKEGDYRTWSPQRDKEDDERDGEEPPDWEKLLGD